MILYFVKKTHRLFVFCELLGENLSGFWSRRIDEENRLIYRIWDGIVEIA
ncbi:MAG: type II toxin-antitoxin system YoeB family toxin [Clostridium sp.]|nr:type II toxin-antitoxin system YoeB family toxin [Clostridium sp.]